MWGFRGWVKFRLWVIEYISLPKKNKPCFLLRLLFLVFGGLISALGLRLEGVYDPPTTKMAFTKTSIICRPGVHLGVPNKRPLEQFTTRAVRWLITTPILMETL